MSEQISENMAHKIFDANEQFNASGLCSGRERFIAALKHFGLIKPSKLDVAREWCEKESKVNITKLLANYQRGYKDGISCARNEYEAAITEILEERE